MHPGVNLGPVKTKGALKELSPTGKKSLTPRFPSPAPSINDNSQMSVSLLARSPIASTSGSGKKGVKSKNTKRSRIEPPSQVTHKTSNVTSDEEDVEEDTYLEKINNDMRKKASGATLKKKSTSNTPSASALALKQTRELLAEYEKTISSMVNINLTNICVDVCLCSLIVP